MTGDIRSRLLGADNSHLDLGGGYLDVFTLLKFTELYT